MVLDELDSRGGESHQRAQAPRRARRQRPCRLTLDVECASVSA